MPTSRERWWPVSNVEEVPSPALLIYLDRALENLRRMVALAGDAARLTPHVKTHKLEPLVRAHLDAGIVRFKCATIAEAESVAVAGGRDVLLAHQPVGPGISRLIALAAQFPQTRVSVIADDAGTIAAIGAAAAAAGRTVPILLDLDVGMHRTGIEPGAAAAELYRSLTTTAGVEAGGLHAYDGHLRDADPAERARKSDAAFADVEVLRRSLLEQRLPVPRVVAGGSPTFPVHARRSGVELSPGTTVLWDAGYASQLPDLAFLPAAVLLTRVVSKPGGNRVTLDLGHKAVASEGPHPRVALIAPDGLPSAPAGSPLGAVSAALGLPLLDVTFVGHSEEHLVLETSAAPHLTVGDAIYGIPWHVCPTVALHAEAVVIRGHAAADRWPIRARDRRLSV